jgi:hypothetical protein
LLGTILGFAVSQTTVLLSHTLQFAVLLATFTNLTQHTLYLCWRRRRKLKSHWECWGPAYTVALSTMCIMLQPTFLVLQVAHKAPEMSGIMGQRVRQAFTVLGYVLLFLGVAWATELWSQLGLSRSSSSRAADL